MNDTGVVDATTNDADEARPGPLVRAARSLGRPPEWWFHGCCALAALLLLWSSGPVGGNLLGLAVSLAVLAVLACTWFVRTVLALVTRQVAAWHLVAPVCGAVVLALVAVDAPLRARWALSEDAFVSAAAELGPAVRENGHVVGDHRLGLIEVTSIDTIGEGGLYFSTSGAPLLADSAIVYLPDGSSPSDHESGSFERPSWVDLGDGWFAVTHSW